MRILLAERSSFSERGLQAFQSIAPTDAFDLTQEELVERIPGYEILLVRLGLRVDGGVLRESSQLKVIGAPTTGLDHIDLAACEQRGVAVLSLKGERAFLDQVYATAEHTFALLLSLERRLPAAFAAVRGGEWRRDRYRGRELNGQTIGIVGCGRLGSMTAGYALAFGMRVLVYDPYQERLPAGVQVCQTLEELLTASDIVSLHVPLNAETQGLLSQAEFARMKPGAILVNTARGAVIDEAALLQALETGYLAGAALDVLCDEPAESGQPSGWAANPLIEYARRHDNLVITPHIGGATQESVEKADLFLANKLSIYLNL